MSKFASRIPAWPQIAASRGSCPLRSGTSESPLPGWAIRCHNSLAVFWTPPKSLSFNIRETIETRQKKSLNSQPEDSQACIHLYIYIYKCVCRYRYVCKCKYLCVYMYVCTYIHISYVSTYTYFYMSTYVTCTYR